MVEAQDRLDALIVGGGFYGLSIALFLREELGLKNIVIIEKETNLMTRASYVNQARVHNGYHYPRSILTAHRSAVNFPVFVDQYAEAVVSDFEKHYAISKVLSKVNARQFVEFCHKINAPIEIAAPGIKKAFNPVLTEEVFRVKEYAFDAHKLRDLLLKRISSSSGIAIYTGESVEEVKSEFDFIKVVSDKRTYDCERVINCTYSQINNLHRKSNLPLVPLKHEITEMCLIQLPKGYDNFSVTVMDGPFFSIMPFPSRGLHTLSHVRYTPHESWKDDTTTPGDRKNAHQYLSETIERKSNFKKMRADVARYIPALAGMKLVDTLREVKTVLVKSEESDSRPILYRSDFGIKNYTCIMGGKIDNIYDVFDELRLTYGR